MKFVSLGITACFFAVCMFFVDSTESFGEDDVVKVKSIKLDEDFKLTNESLLLVNTALAEFNKHSHLDIENYALALFRTEDGYTAMFYDFTASSLIKGGGGLEIDINENFEVVRWYYAK